MSGSTGDAPGRSQYGIGCASMVLGLLTLIFVPMRLLSGGDNLVRFAVPGEIVFEAEEPGAYSVFHEYRSNFGGEIYSAASGGLAGLVLDIRARDTGEPVEVSAPNVTSTYSIGGRSGVAVASFDVSEAGPYVVSASSAGDQRARAVLAVGKGVVARLLVTMLGSFLAAGVFGCAGLVLVARTYSLRRGTRPTGSVDESGSAAATPQQ